MSFISVIGGIVMMLAVFGGANYYVGRRLYRWMCVIPTGESAFLHISIPVSVGVYVAIVLLMVLGFARSMLPVPATVKNALGWVGSYGMGVFIYLFLYFLAADVLMLLGRLFRLVPSPVPPVGRFGAGLAVVLLTVATVGYGMYHAGQIKHVAYEVYLDGLEESARPSEACVKVSLGDVAQGDVELEDVATNEMKIVMISDLHLGALDSEERLAGIVDEINGLEPDLVCMAGDIFDNDYEAIRDPDEAARLLGNISATYGVYACLGNHDAGETLGEMEKFLERSGIQLLNDEYVVIDGRFILAGRLDSSPIGGFGDMNRTEFARVMEGAPQTLPVVVMDHNPANIGEYGSEVDLVLCGHTHRGQIFPGSLFTRLMYVVDYGHYQKDAESPHVIVSSGVGTWGMPMRVGTDCEIVSVTLRHGSPDVR